MAKRRSTKPDAPLKDAPRDLVLTVTERDIAGADRRKTNSCAAANALCRQEKYAEARVFKTKTYVKLRDGSWQRFCTPGSLYVELMIYDRGGRMAAGDFVLRAPKGIEKLGAHVKPRGPHLTTGKPSRSMHTIENVRESAKRGPALFKDLFG